MKLNNNLIIGAALLGGGAYYAFKKGLFGKKTETPNEAIKQNQDVINKVAAEQAAAAAAAAAVVKTRNEVRQASTIINTNSYAGKVSYIQQKLGIAVDGNPGTSANSQTNKNYAAVYGLDKGIISPNNIDYYKEKVEKKLTLTAQKAAAAVAAKKAASVVNVANDAKRFLELVNNGKYKATLKKDVKANTFIYDNLKKAYVDVNEPVTFPKNMSFGKGQFSNVARGGYVLKTGANNKYFALNPADFLVTL
jgi:hypothetical protein